MSKDGCTCRMCPKPYANVNVCIGKVCKIDGSILGKASDITTASRFPKQKYGGTERNSISCYYSCCCCRLLYESENMAVELEKYPKCIFAKRKKTFKPLYNSKKLSKLHLEPRLSFPFLSRSAYAFVFVCFN